ncbi:MAG: zinc ribbon domain-containing protein, partial [Patescibacteria group bacterium]|nr:zinc ribbon domain-containing protein [Patescibacteria group bacterium]
YASKNLAFRGLITCANCGCRVTGEVKKGKYTYWHCTNYHGNCKREYIPEKNLDDQIISLLKDMTIPDDKLEMLVTELKKSHEDKVAYHSSIMSGLQNEYNRIESHIETMYEDHLEKRITNDQYDKLLETKKKRQLEILDTMEIHRRADKTYYITAERLLTLASHAVDYYKSSKPDEKRELLHFLLSNCQLNHKKLDFTLKQPFDTILHYASRSQWLRGQDSNL